MAGYETVRITVRLPACVAECLSRAYGDSAPAAVRRFILDVLREKTIELPDECEECVRMIKGGGVRCTRYR